MGTSSIDTDNDFEPDRELGEGHDIASLGPSDSSDSGSDMAGLPGRHSDTDATGTGERVGVRRDETEDADARDIDTDRIEQGPDTIDVEP